MSEPKQRPVVTASVALLLVAAIGLIAAGITWQRRAAPPAAELTPRASEDAPAAPPAPAAAPPGSAAAPPDASPAPETQRFTIRGWCELEDASPKQILPLDPTGAPGTLPACPRNAIVRFTYRSPVDGALFVLQDVAGALSWVSPLAANVVPTGLRATSEPKALPVRLRPPLPDGGPQLLFVLAPPGTTGEAVMAAATELRATEAIATRLGGRATVLSVPTR